MATGLTARELRYFEALARHLSYRKAAEELFISQPALSAAIKQMESTNGVTLFVRSTHSVSLSAAAEAWLPAVRNALAALENAEAELRSLVARDAMHVVVGYPIGTGADLLFRITCRLRQEHPELHVEAREFDFSDPTAGLSSGQVDVALIRPPVETDGCVMVPLETERWVACVPRDHPLADRATAELAEFLGDPIIAAPAEAGLWRDFWLAMADRAGVPPTIGGVAHNYESEVTLVSRGLGISFTTEASARLYQRPGVTYIPLRGAPSSYVALAWRPGRLAPAARLVIEAALREWEILDHTVRPTRWCGHSRPL